MFLFAHAGPCTPARAMKTESIEKKKIQANNKNNPGKREEIDVRAMKTESIDKKKYKQRTTKKSRKKRGD